MQKCKAIFATDIDNTLTDERHLIPDEVASYIARLYEEGIGIVFLTGRTFSFAYQSMEKFDFPYLLVLQNGADILTMPEKKVTGQHYLSYETIKVLSDVYRDDPKEFLVYAGFEKGDFCYYCKKECTDKMLSYFEHLKRLVPEAWREVKTWDELSDIHYPLIKCVGKKEKIIRMQKELLELNLQENVVVIRDVIDRDMHLLLITHSDANKGITLNKLRRLHNWTCPIIAAGDDNNDIELLQNSDIPIAMGDGSPDLIKIAQIVAKPSREYGIIEAVEEARKRLKV